MSTIVDRYRRPGQTHGEATLFEKLDLFLGFGSIGSFTCSPVTCPVIIDYLQLGVLCGTVSMGLFVANRALIHTNIT